MHALTRLVHRDAMLASLNILLGMVEMVIVRSLDLTVEILFRLFSSFSFIISVVVLDKLRVAGRVEEVVAVVGAKYRLDTDAHIRVKVLMLIHCRLSHVVLDEVFTSN